MQDNPYRSPTTEGASQANPTAFWKRMAVGSFGLATTIAGVAVLGDAVRPVWAGSRLSLVTLAAAATMLGLFLTVHTSMPRPNGR